MHINRSALAKKWQLQLLNCYAIIHEGNIGNRCNDHISDNINKIVAALLLMPIIPPLTQVQLVGRLFAPMASFLVTHFVRSVRESSFVNGD